jgi:hypothetical protein
MKNMALLYFLLTLILFCKGQNNIWEEDLHLDEMQNYMIS